MKRKIDFFEVFRESGRNLKITPSGSAWSKLERRLEAKKRRRRLLLLNATGVAATILLLIGLGALLSVLSNRQHIDPAFSDTILAPVQLQQPEPASATDSLYLYKVEFSRQHLQETNLIEEGSRDQKLVLSLQAETGSKSK